MPYVTDQSVRVIDTETGNRRPLKFTSAGNRLRSGACIDAVVDKNKNVYLLARVQNNFGPFGIVKLDRANATMELICAARPWEVPNKLGPLPQGAAPPRGDGDDFEEARGIALDHSQGRLFVAQTGGLVAVDCLTGNRETVWSRPVQPDGRAEFALRGPIVVPSDGKVLAVTDDLRMRGNGLILIDIATRAFEYVSGEPQSPPPPIVRGIKTPPARGSGPPLLAACGLAIGPDGRIYVAHRDGLMQVESTGDRRELLVVSTPGGSSGAASKKTKAADVRGTVGRVAVGPEGDVWLEVGGSIGSIAADGTWTEVSSKSRGSGPVLGGPIALAVAERGKNDPVSSTKPAGLKPGDILALAGQALLRIDSQMRKAFVISGVEKPGYAPVGGHDNMWGKPAALVVHPNGKIYVADIGSQAIYSVNPADGARTVLSRRSSSLNSPTDQGQGPPFNMSDGGDRPQSCLAVDVDRLYVIRGASTVVEVNLETGDRTELRIQLDPAQVPETAKNNSFNAAFNNPCGAAWSSRGDLIVGTSGFGVSTVDLTRQTGRRPNQPVRGAQRPYGFALINGETCYMVLPDPAGDSKRSQLVRVNTNTGQALGINVNPALGIASAMTATDDGRLVIADQRRTDNRTRSYIVGMRPTGGANATAEVVCDSMQDGDELGVVRAIAVVPAPTAGKTPVGTPAADARGSSRPIGSSPSQPPDQPAGDGDFRLAPGQLWAPLPVGPERPAANVRKQATLFSPDGSVLAAFYRNGTLRLWDMVARRALATIDSPDGNPVDAKNGTPVAAFSPDGKLIAVAAGRGTARVRVWDAKTGLERSDLKGPSELRNMNGLALAADGKSLAVVARPTSTSKNTTLMLWDLSAGEQTHLLQEDQHQIVLAFAPDGRTLASGSSDGTLRLWDPATGKELSQDKQHTEVRTLRFSSDSKALLSFGDASDGGLIKVWDISPRLRMRKAFRGTHLNISDVCFWDETGTRVAAAGVLDTYGTVLTLWNVASGDVHGNFTLRLPLIFFDSLSPDRKTLAAPNVLPETGGGFKASHPDQIELWNMTAVYAVVAARSALPHPGLIRSLSLSPDGKFVATGALGPLVKGKKNERAEIRLWDQNTGKQLGKPLEFDRVHSVAFSPDSKQLAIGAAGQAGELGIVEVPQGKSTPVLKTEKGRSLGGITWSLDGQVIAAGGNNSGMRSVTVWTKSADTVWTKSAEKRLDDKSLLERLLSNYSPLTGISPNAKTLAVAGSTQILLWGWEANDVRVLAPAKPDGGSGVQALYWRDENTLVSLCSNGMSSWDVSTGQETIVPLEFLRRYPPAVAAFTADGSFLAIGGSGGGLNVGGGGQITLWEPQTQRLLATLDGFTGGITHLAVSPDGKTVVAAGHDTGSHFVKLWDVGSVLE